MTMISDHIPTENISMPHNFASVWKMSVFPSQIAKSSPVFYSNGTVRGISNELSIISLLCPSSPSKKKPFFSLQGLLTPAVSL